MKPTLKEKAPKKTLRSIKHGRVVYNYIIGLSWIQIETSKETDWPEMPE